ncbi:heterokaryon incompatibility protein-domain-containing protein [Xylogone sp. PMI_703]|nr:heterokaryon incompatibility protein-domain-containing protein [Xylogone sp. PMI_703]
MESIKEARLLVCNQCWQDIFNTEDFQRTCSCQESGCDHNHGLRFEKTVRQINISAVNGCNWCSYIHTSTSKKEGVGTLDDVVRIKLRPFHVDHSTPIGRNTFIIVMHYLRERGLGWNLDLYAFTNDKDNAARFVTARQLQPEVNTDAAQKQIKSWLAECSHHDSCPAQPESILPTRVIEIDPPNSSGKPRLLVSEGKRGKYVALSYCWGTNPYGSLGLSNLEEYTKHLDLEKLPQTLRDAITITKSISIPYLWVDSLCILQDSEFDKQHEISMMKTIYENSFVTIVAASSESVTHGFLQTRRKPLESDVEYDESLEPINKRAWTLQEQLMSHRYLIYASNTLQWRCKVGVRNLGDSLHIDPYSVENRYSETFSALAKSTAGQETELKRWLRIVHIYSWRLASHSCDKLNAIAGIAMEFSYMLGPGYYAGLWKFSLLWQLTWSTLNWYQSPYLITRPTVYRAPSWSWASVDGRISYDKAGLLDDDNQQFLYRCETISCETELKSPDFLFGEITAASLKIKAVLRQAWFNPAIETWNVLWLAEDDKTLGAAEALHLANLRQDNPEDANIEKCYAYTFTGQYDVSGGWGAILVSCLPIAAFEERISIGLLLVQTDGGTFRRIGSFRNARRNDFGHLQENIITII